MHILSLVLVIDNSPTEIIGRNRRKYFMINLHESMKPGPDRTKSPWICNRPRCRLPCGARLIGFRDIKQINKMTEMFELCITAELGLYKASRGVFFHASFLFCFCFAAFLVINVGRTDLPQRSNCFSRGFRQNF